MREIKFRQWYKNKFHYFGYTNGIIQGPCSASLERDPIDQYTGIKDKNGKEIYEGDIFSTDVESGCNWIALFENGAWVGKNTFWAKGFDSCGLIARKHLGEIRVIGNIHENPELIGGNMQRMGR